MTARNFRSVPPGNEPEDDPARLRARAEAAERRFAERVHEVERLRRALARAKAEVQAYRTSTVWRLTAPLRATVVATRFILRRPREALRLGGALARALATGGPRKAAGALRAFLAARAHAMSPLRYARWIEEHDVVTAADRAAMTAAAARFERRPVFSVVMPVYDAPEPFLRAAIDSVLDQTYDQFELCIADDCSSAPHVRAILEDYRRRDARVKVVFREENGHISRASNSALALASGEWTTFLDHDDALAPHALFCLAEALDRRPEAMLLYSDEDKLDAGGARAEPYFKSDWNERLFFEQNMICHLAAYRTDLVREIGGFREGFEGSQDHDLALRYVERIAPEAIVHIPHVLYHWRMSEGSTALAPGEKNYALEAGLKALKDCIARRGLAASVEAQEGLAYYRLKMRLPDPAPRTTIIIPTRDGLKFLKPCIESILEKTDYPNYEILIVDNQSREAETLAYFEDLAGRAPVEIMRYDAPFNFSAINNAAVRRASGDFVCLLNNDTEAIAPGWLSELVAEASRPGVGAAGAKLLYTDGTVQHAGVVLGVGGADGVAGHAFLNIAANHGGYFSRNLLAGEVSAVTAACMVLPKRLFEAVGGLDEDNLKIAFNDIDLCLKIRAAGYKVVWTPQALLYHHESKTRGLEDTPEKQARFAREVRFMLAKWGAVLQSDPYYNPNLSLDAETFSLASEPRVLRPWLAEGGAVLVSDLIGRPARPAP